MYPFRILNKKKYILFEINAFILNLVLYVIPVLVSIFLAGDFTTERFISFIIWTFVLLIIYLVTDCIWCIYASDFFGEYQKDLDVSYCKRIIQMPLAHLNELHSGYLKKQTDIVSSESTSFLKSIFNNVNGVLISGSIFLVSVYFQDKKIFFLCCIVIIGIILYNLFMGKRVVKSQKRYNEHYSKFSSTHTDLLQNVKTIKRLDASEYAIDKINESYHPVKGALHRLNVVFAQRYYVIDLALDFMFLFILLNLLYQMKNGQNIIGYLTFYVTMFNGLKSEMKDLATVFQSYSKLKAAHTQVEAMLGNYPEEQFIDSFKTIQIQNVEFKYTQASHQKICIPEFTLNAKEKISIIGKSGQGKTTFLNILSKFLEVPTGQYLIDGKVQEGKIDVAYISQDVDLLNTTIYDNICLGKEISEQKLQKILKDAGLLEWIHALPEGLDTVVGERGLKLSAGQKQRINIIRGILLNKKIYILDEPTSNLDMETEQQIIHLIEQYLKQKTVLIVTHRLDVQKICDKHYIFENGVMKQI